MKTKAAILVEQKTPLVLDEVEIPQLGYGQVLVRVRASRICGSQIGEIDGVKGQDRWLPHLLGHEGSGDVLELGPGVSHVKVDDRVVLHWRPSRGIQCAPPKYKWRDQTVNAGFVTTFNEYAVVSENRLTVVDKDVSDDFNCLLADTLTTGFGVVCRDARLLIGETVLIIGCGGIGLGAILGAKLAGAYPIIAVDLSEEKLQLAKRYGATHTILRPGNTLDEQVLSCVPAGVDVSIDCTGIPEVIEAAYKVTKAQGRCVLLGVMRHNRKLSLNTLSFHHGKNLIGSEGGSSQPHDDIPRYIEMLRNACFDTDAFISHRGTLEDVNELMAEMRSGNVTHAIMNYTAE